MLVKSLRYSSVTFSVEKLIASCLLLQAIRSINVRMVDQIEYFLRKHRRVPRLYPEAVVGLTAVVG